MRAVVAAIMVALPLATSFREMYEGTVEVRSLSIGRGVAAPSPPRHQYAQFDAEPCAWGLGWSASVVSVIALVTPSSCEGWRSEGVEQSSSGAAAIEGAKVTWHGCSQSDCKSIAVSLFKSLASLYVGA